MVLDMEFIKSGEKNEVSENILKIVPYQKIDQTNANIFADILLTLIKGGVRKMVIDFSEINYIDSSGIGKIINITKVIRKLGGNVTITRCNEKIMEILSLVKLDTFIKFFASNEEGINYLQFL